MVPQASSCMASRYSRQYWSFYDQHRIRAENLPHSRNKGLFILWTNISHSRHEGWSTRSRSPNYSNNNSRRHSDCRPDLNLGPSQSRFHIHTQTSRSSFGYRTFWHKLKALHLSNQIMDIDSDSVYLTLNRLIKDDSTTTRNDRKAFEVAKRGEIDFLLQRAVAPIKITDVSDSVQLQPLK